MSALALTVAAWLQIYYELKAEREKQGLEKQIALIRVEQLAPFPFDLVCRELRRYPNADIMWCAVPHHPIVCSAALANFNSAPAMINLSCHLWHTVSCTCLHCKSWYQVLHSLTLRSIPADVVFHAMALRRASGIGAHQG